MNLSILFFTSFIWCEPCLIAQKKLDKLCKEFDVSYATIDIDKDTDLIIKYNIGSIPTILLLNNEQEINRIIGAERISPMRKIFREALDVKNY